MIRVIKTKAKTFLWAIPLLFLAIFFFYPLSATFYSALQTALERGTQFFQWSRIGQSLWFTFWQAGVSTLLTFFIGMPAAYLFAKFKFPGKSLLRTLTTIPFIMPTVVVAVSFNALLGPNGWLNTFLMGAFHLASPPINILNTIGAILLAHVFYNTSVVIRVVGTAWSQLDTRMEQAARVLGASPLKVLREIILPLLKPSVIAALLLVFLFDFTSFAVILLLGGPKYATLEVEIYIQALQMLNLPMAAILSAIQLVCTLALTVTYSKMSGTINVPLIPKFHNESERRPHKSGEIIFVGGMVILLLAMFVLPLFSPIVGSLNKQSADRGERGEVQTGWTLSYYQELFINRRQSLFYVPPIAAIKNSLVYAGETVGISLLLGVIAADALAKSGKTGRVFDSILMIPLGTSAVTLGLGFVLVFNRPPLDVRTFPALIPIAHSLVALPFVVRILKPAISSIPVSLRQAASILGASPLRVWLEVDFPIILRSVIAAAIFAFTISLGEFGATTFLARPEYPTIPIAIYRYMSQPGAMNYGQAMAMSTILLVTCTGGIILVERLRLPGNAEF
ncbi:MAG: iron ABC transporter permease [Anaerolineaceae bacterium]